jgi:hypothetical protein
MPSKDPLGLALDLGPGESRQLHRAVGLDAQAVEESNVSSATRLRSWAAGTSSVGSSTRRNPMRPKIRHRAGRWFLAVVDDDGQEHAHGGYRTQREAKDAYKALVAGPYSAPAKGTVADYLAAWLETREAADISPGTYGNALRGLRRRYSTIYQGGRT